MTGNEEHSRVDENIHGEPAPPVEVRVVALVDGDPAASLSRMREVMRVVAERRRREWPDDTWWESHLPRWFVEPFRERTMDQVLQDPDLWDFGSWLDAMKSPGWEWWSSERTPSGWTVRLQALSDPFSIGPLEYLARAAGAARLEVQES